MRLSRQKVMGGKKMVASRMRVEILNITEGNHFSLDLLKLLLGSMKFRFDCWFSLGWDYSENKRGGPGINILPA